MEKNKQLQTLDNARDQENKIWKILLLVLMIKNDVSPEVKLLNKMNEYIETLKEISLGLFYGGDSFTIFAKWTSITTIDEVENFLNKIENFLHKQGKEENIWTASDKIYEKTLELSDIYRTCVTSLQERYGPLEAII